MLDTTLTDRSLPTATQLERRAKIKQYAMLLFVLLLTANAALSTMQGNVSLAWLFFLGGMAAIIYEPRYGVYLIMFFGLIGDATLSPWFPFTKNLSSRESLLFLSDAFSFSPAELYIMLTLVVWFVRMAFQRRYKIITGPMFWPCLAFTIFMAYALVYGIARGGNTNIALWESRPTFYIFIMMFLVSNLFKEPKHFSILMWLIVFALWIEGWFGVYTTIFELSFDLSQVETITEHSAAQHYNTVFVFILALWLFRGTSLRKRFIIPIMIPPIALTYIATQRRSAFLTLGIALMLFAIFLYRERRGAFWLIVPPSLVFGAIYVAAFWNSSSALAIPAQAVKSIVAEDEASQADLNSNLYRDIENLNAEYTIHQRPLTGVGFGNKFFIVYPMPDISFFTWWEYIIHNSIIWIWIKSGVFGFLSMIFMVGMGLFQGVRNVLQMPGGDMAAIATTAVLYVVMHFTFAYVDMSWSDQSMLYIGTAFGLINIMDPVVNKTKIQRQKALPKAQELYV